MNSMRLLSLALSNSIDWSVIGYETDGNTITVYGDTRENQEFSISDVLLARELKIVGRKLGYFILTWADSFDKHAKFGCSIEEESEGVIVEDCPYRVLETQAILEAFGKIKKEYYER